MQIMVRNSAIRFTPEQMKLGCQALADWTRPARERVRDTTGGHLRYAVFAGVLGLFGNVFLDSGEASEICQTWPQSAIGSDLPLQDSERNVSLSTGRRIRDEFWRPAIAAHERLANTEHIGTFFRIIDAEAYDTISGTHNGRQARISLSPGVLVGEPGYVIFELDRPGGGEPLGVGVGYGSDGRIDVDGVDQEGEFEVGRALSQQAALRRASKITGPVFRTLYGMDCQVPGGQ